MPKLIDIDSLFAATINVFAERGYDAATTQVIARQAAVSEVTLYRRYGSKAKLIEAALNHCLSQSPFGRVKATGDVKADLTAIVLAYQETYRADGGAVLTLMTEMARHTELRSAISVLMPNLKNAASIIAAHQHGGRIGPGDPLQKLGFLIAPVLGAGIWACTGVAMDAFKLDAPTIVDKFLNGHRPEG